MRTLSFALLLAAALPHSTSSGQVAAQEEPLAHDPPGYTNSLGMEFVAISPGCFQMGTPAPADNPRSNESPPHRVCISQGFQLSRYEVTQAQWNALMPNNPSAFKGAGRPAEQVTWEEAQEFVQRLNQQEKCDGCYRLPSEAEWEYAARAGSAGRYAFGGSAERLGEYAWYEDNAGGQTQLVGQKQPNAWGLHDMHGNIWEWVEDCFHPNYTGAPVDGSAWGKGCEPFSNGTVPHVVRGGAWSHGADASRSAARSCDCLPDHRHSDFGFRVARRAGATAGRLEAVAPAPLLE